MKSFFSNKLIVTLLSFVLLISSHLNANTGLELARRVYPNPFRTSTTFQLKMPNVEKIQIIVLILLEGKLELFMTECILKVTTQFFGMGMMIMEFQFLKALIFVHYLQMTLQ